MSLWPLFRNMALVGTMIGCGTLLVMATVRGRALNRTLLECDSTLEGIIGKVIDARDHSELEGVSVYLHRTRAGWSGGCGPGVGPPKRDLGIMICTTDIRGMFQGVSPYESLEEVVELTFKAKGYESVVLTMNSCRLFDEEILVGMRRSTSFRGRVVDEGGWPVVGALGSASTGGDGECPVELKPFSSRLVGRGRIEVLKATRRFETDAMGEFVVRGLSPGMSGSVWIRKEGYEQGWASIAPLASRGLNFGGDIVMCTHLDARGSVTLNGTPVRGYLRFEALPGKRTRDTNVCWDENGEFTARLVRGRYRVTPHLTGLGFTAEEFASMAREVTIRGDRTSDSAIRFYLSAPMTRIEGTVLNERGIPRAGVTLVAVPIPQEQERHDRRTQISAESGEDGTFRFEIPAGRAPEYWIEPAASPRNSGRFMPGSIRAAEDSAGLVFRSCGEGGVELSLVGLEDVSVGDLVIVNGWRHGTHERGGIHLNKWAKPRAPIASQGPRALHLRSLPAGTYDFSLQPFGRDHVIWLCGVEVHNDKVTKRTVKMTTPSRVSVWRLEGEDPCEIWIVPKVLAERSLRSVKPLFESLEDLAQELRTFVPGQEFLLRRRRIGPGRGVITERLGPGPYQVLCFTGEARRLHSEDLSVTDDENEVLYLP